MLKNELNTSEIFAQRELLTYLIDEEKDHSFQEQTIFLRENSDEMPLSFAAQRLWFVNQLDPSSSSQNNLSMALRSKGVLNVAALEQSINEILRRHEALRINISTVQGQPVQVIVPSITLTLPIVDLQELPESECENEAQHLLIKESQRFFDLNKGSLLRVMLIRLRKEEHIIFLMLHGIVSDYCSMGILLKEIVLLYEAFSTGNPSPLRQLPIQYADFASWQRQRLQGKVLETQLVYWKQQLGGSLPVLQLPIDYPRPPMQTFRGARQSIAFSSTLSEALKALSSQEGVTLFTTLLAAFKVLLYRYTAQEDILVGTPTAGRYCHETKDLIGCFANLLVLRTDFSGNSSFQKLLEQVHKVTLEAYAHREMPLEKLVEELQIEQDLSRNPLFQALFVLQNAQKQDIGLSSLTMSPVEVYKGTSNFDLTLYMDYSEQELIGTLEYSTDLFEAATITRMLGHLQTLLEGIVADPLTRISDLPLVTSKEQHQLLVEWNNTQIDFPKDVCLHQLFEAQVELTPDAVAITFEDQHLTYRELNQRANKLANDLQTIGVKPEVAVGLCMDRSLEIAIGLLGILKAGGACVPFELMDPPEFLAFMLADTQLSVLLTQKQLLEENQFLKKVSEGGMQVVCVDQDREDSTLESTKAPSTEVKITNAAYIVYTSGSTGRPKGVIISHLELCSRQLWLQSVFQLNAADRFQMAIYRGLVIHYALLSPLLFGGTVVIARPGGQRDINYLVRMIVEHQITGVYSVPSLLPFFLKAQGIENCNSLKHVFCGSEPLPIEFQEYFFSLLNAELHNLYGLTEATFSTLLNCKHGVKYRSDQRIVPIGHPAANTQIYLLDSHLQLVPIGVPGELYVGGANLARGYLNRPDLTAARFIPNHFSNEPGSRLYKTGDLARYLPDGNIEYLGRIDRQVKLRGFRIELGEIEAVLDQHAAVRKAVVVDREDIPGNKRLIAYVVPQPETTLTLKELRSFVAKKLPNFMIPSTFVLLDTLPITPSGRIDRNALPTPDNARLEHEETFAAPRNLVEEKLAAIWAEVLELERVGIYDNFFELGGDSILSIQLISRANQLNIPLTPKQLFEYQTIAELAAVVDLNQIVQAEQGLVTGSVLLTPVQRWFFEQKLPQSHHWNQAIMLEVEPNLNLEALELAIGQLLVHHDALRLRFVQQKTDWHQAIALPDSAPIFTQVDLSEVEETAIEKAASEIQASLNLSDGPLLRTALFEMGAGKPSRLLLVIHHLVVDGVSWRILLADLQAAYQQIIAEKAIELPPKTTSFKDWAERLNEYAQSVELEQEIGYWVAESRTNISSLPVDYCKGDNTEASAQTISLSLSAEETQFLLQEVPKVYNTQINEVLMTALAQTFSRWMGTQRLLIDLEGHGREEIFAGVNLSRTVGWFTTIYPVLLELKESHPGEALKSVKEQLRHIPARGISYGILRYLKGDAELTKKLQSLPQAEVIFNYLGQLDQVLSPSSIFRPTKESSGLSRSLLGNRSHLLEINALVVEGQMQLNWTYSENFHQMNTILELAQAFVRALQYLIAHCQSPEAGGYTPSDFPLASLSQNELNNMFEMVEFEGR